MAAPVAKPRRKRRLSRRLGIALLIILVVLAVVVIRYAIVVFTALDAKSSAQRLSDDIHAISPADLTHDRLATLGAEIDGVRNDVSSLRSFLSSDPLVGLMRNAAEGHKFLSEADSLMAAAADVADAGETAIALGNKFVALREGGADTSLLAGVVKLMATSSGDVDHIHDLIVDAQQRLATIPPDANGEILHSAQLMSEPLAKYLPLLDQYRGIDKILPPILGWGSARRYLVLAMDPAELRPNGGYTGTVGVVKFDNGSLAEHTFTDVYNYDLKKRDTGVAPPIELQNHLLNDQQWQLADAAWSPDFPTSAQNALKLYTIESGDSDVGGVISLTTYAVDKLMEVTGPITVEDDQGKQVTVEPGQVTLNVLGQTRGISTPGSNRKSFLNTLSNALMDKLFSLPPAKWIDLYNAFQEISSERLMQVWLKDPTEEALVANGPLGGAIQPANGDYVYVVEANVAPSSKYNLVTTRTDLLHVAVDGRGDAKDVLRMTWQNDAMKPGEPYASIRSYSNSTDGLYGCYVRLVTRGNTQLESATGEASDPVTDVETNEPEENHNVFGNYLLIPPGNADLTYTWDSPAVAVHQPNGQWVYRLQLQRQAAIGPKNVAVQVQLPQGARVSQLTTGATARGNIVSFNTPLLADQLLQIGYSLP